MDTTMEAYKALKFCPECGRPLLITKSGWIVCNSHGAFTVTGNSILWTYKRVSSETN